jgi:hypothetical protein
MEKIEFSAEKQKLYTNEQIEPTNKNEGNFRSEKYST